MECKSIVNAPYQCRICEHIICKECRTRDINTRWQICRACSKADESTRQKMMDEARKSDLFVPADGFVLLYLSSLRFKCRNTVHVPNLNVQLLEEEKKESSHEIEEHS